MRCRGLRRRLLPAPASLLAVLVEGARRLQDLSRWKVFTFTKDHLVPNPHPPTVMVSADIEGGGRFYGQLTASDPATVGFEMPVELCFRRIHEGERCISYIWKFRPV